MIKNLLRYFHTIRYLKISQIIWRLIKLIKKTNISAPKLLNQRALINDWHQIRIAKIHTLDQSKFVFLNKQQDYSGEIDWNDSKQDMLWLFNLHYFDDLCAPFDCERDIWHQELIINWIDNNPPMHGVGWEAYPLSLRIVNWIKWSLNGENVDPFLLDSLKLQSHILSQNIEYHLLGNHILANAKALIFAGLFFKGKQAEYWLNLGLKIYDNQLKEQVFSDGGHFELSSMYQNIMLFDLLDIINIASTYDHSSTRKFLDHWHSTAGLMLSWAKTMKHPDGDISFFNDASFDIAPKYKELLSYARDIGVNECAAPKENYGNTELTYLSQSGYVRIEQEKLVAILDCARIGPDYLPGHAHADTLSFELSLQNFRVFVNSGTSCYGISDERVRQRGTAAHNTVIVDNIDSTQVWSGFRVAKRAYPTNFLVEGNDINLKISCAHDGYKSLKNSLTHHRDWCFGDNAITITDRLRGSYKTAEANYLLHPDIEISALEDYFILILPNLSEIKLKFFGGKARLIDTFWYPEFGKSIPTKGIVLNATKDKMGVCIKDYI
ncbi:heparinase II/III family protein [Gammaproteobacteria bacterium]|nr:heparinase II/III family protein [Gammaproteobacteria bacterium]